MCVKLVEPGLSFTHCHWVVTIAKNLPTKWRLTAEHVNRHHAAKGMPYYGNWLQVHATQSKLMRFSCFQEIWHDAAGCLLDQGCQHCMHVIENGGCWSWPGICGTWRVSISCRAHKGLWSAPLGVLTATMLCYMPHASDNKTARRSSRLHREVLAKYMVSRLTLASDPNRFCRHACDLQTWAQRCLNLVRTETQDTCCAQCHTLSTLTHAPELQLSSLGRLQAGRLQLGSGMLCLHKHAHLVAAH